MMAMVAATLAYISASSQRHNALPMACKTLTVLPRRCWAAGSEGGCALVLQQFEGGIENLTRVGVTLALHILHPLVPDRLARALDTERRIVERIGVTVVHL